MIEGPLRPFHPLGTLSLPHLSRNTLKQTPRISPKQNRAPNYFSLPSNRNLIWMMQHKNIINQSYSLIHIFQWLILIECHLACIANATMNFSLACCKFLALSKMELISFKSSSSPKNTVVSSFVSAHQSGHACSPHLNDPHTQTSWISAPSRQATISKWEMHPRDLYTGRLSCLWELCKPLCHVKGMV